MFFGLNELEIRVAVLFAFSLLVMANPIFAAIDQADEQAPLAAETEILPEADQLTFATSLEKAAKDGDADAINKLIDWNRLVDTAIAGEDSDALNRARIEFRRGFVKSQKRGNKNSLGQQIVDATKQDGSFKFLRLSQVDNQPIAFFRLKVGKQGVNYHQYFLKRSKDGLVRADDVYIFLSAERFTDSIRRTWLPLAADVSKTFLDKLTKPADPMIESLKTLVTLQQLVRDGQGEEALKIYRDLPEKVRQDKTILLLRLLAAQLVSDEEYSAAIMAYRKHHPGDAALDFLLIDGYALKKDFAKALECLDRTNKIIGGDAHLTSLRAIILSELDRFDEAKESADEAIRMEPDAADAYWNAVAISLKAKANDDTVNYLNLIEKELGIKITDLTKIPIYADFVKTSEYTKWMESRK